MGILSSLTYKDFEKSFLKLGFKKLRQKGSHVLFGNAEGKVIVIPHHTTKGKLLKKV